ncbi:MAG TPA: hypothetical protein VHX65_03030, partial [Pirellulales bacterium]|nr:hypothetical protein [Pirellulales bacterium]
MSSCYRARVPGHGGTAKGNRFRTDGKQRSRHGAATSDEIAEDAEEDGEEQDCRKTWKEKMILFIDEDRAYLS